MNLILSNLLILGSVYRSKGIISSNLRADEKYKLHTYEVRQRLNKS